MSPNERVISERRLIRNGISSFLNNEHATIQSIRVICSTRTEGRILSISIVPRWRPSGLVILSRFVTSRFSLRNKSVRDRIKATALRCYNKNVSSNRYGELTDLISQLEADFE